MPSANRQIEPKLDKYEILSEIGSGAMGCVYKARHTFMNRFVAVKVISPNLVFSDDARRRAMREARISANLNHPNIVQTHDVEQVMIGDAFTICTIYEFVVGITLSQYLEKHSTPPFQEALRIGREICTGMAHAHENGIVHRDLKPDNIMLADGQTVKIADFGLARDLDRHDTVTQEGVIVGTPRYMAPEQIKAVPSKDLTPAVDVYAIGVILYRLFTGQFPFDGNTPAEILQKSLSQKPPRPSLYMPSLPAVCDRIIMRALAKDTTKRYASAGHLLAELDSILEKGQVKPLPKAQQTVFERTSEKALPPRTVVNVPASAKRTSLSRSAKVVKPSGTGASSTHSSPVGSTDGRRSLMRKLVPALFILLVIGLLSFHQVQKGGQVLVGTSGGTDPVPMAKELLEKYENAFAPPIDECGKLGKLVLGSRQFKHFGIDSSIAPDALGLYFLVLYSAKSKLYQTSLKYNFMLISRAGSSSFEIGGKTIVEDLMDRYLSWHEWGKLESAFESFSELYKKLTVKDVISIATKLRDAVHQLRKDSLLKEIKISGIELGKAGEDLLVAIELIDRFPFEQWSLEDLDERVHLYCSLIILNDSVEATRKLADLVSLVRRESALLGLNKALVLKYAAIQRIYNVPLSLNPPDFEERKKDAIAYLKEALASLRPEKKDTRARIKSLLAAVYCRSMGALGASVGQQVKLGDSMLSEIKRDELRPETRALINALQAYVKACGGEREAAQKILNSMEPTELDKNDRWWFYRARTEIVLSGKGNRHQLNNDVEPLVNLAPAVFHRYVTSVIDLSSP